MTGKVAYDVFRFSNEKTYESGVVEFEREWPFDFDPKEANDVQIQAAARIIAERETGENIRSIVILGGDFYELITD